MKTYEQFAAELSPEVVLAAKALFDSSCDASEPLMCYSDRPSDADYFIKLI